MLRIHQSVYFAGSSSSRTKPWVLVLPVVLCLLPAMAGGGIDVSESHLHDGQTVYGLNAATTPIPYLNDQDITLWAWGETDPLLYHDVGFTARGLFSFSHTVDLVNEGTVNVNAVGGNVKSTLSADAEVRGYGLYAWYDVDNSGDLTVTITGGAAEADDGWADAYMRGYGIWTNDAASNSGNIAVTISGGTAEADDGRADASIFGAGLGMYDGISNSGNVAVTITGGMAEADDGGADTSIFGLGLWTFREVNNSGNIDVTVTGGTAEASDGVANASVSGHGIDTHGKVSNSGNINVTVTGGTAEANDEVADASTFGCGLCTDEEAKIHIFSSGTPLSTEDITVTTSDRQLSNTGDITVTGTGGTAISGGVSITGPSVYSSVPAEIYGIYTSAGDVNNTGSIEVTSTGGTAEIRNIDTISATSSVPEALAYTTAHAAAYGIYAPDSDVNNTGAITVTSNGGTAEIHDIDTISSDLSLVGAFVSVSASPYGVYATDGDVNNTAVITVTSYGGTAEIHDVNTILSSALSRDNSSLPSDASSDVSASPHTTAYGIYVSSGDVNSTGAITVTSNGGTAEIHDIDTISSGFSPVEASASADAVAYGIRALNSDVNNTGAITVTSNGGTAEIYNIDTISSVLSSAQVSASALATVYGIDAHHSDINNTGAITVTSNGGMAEIHGINTISSSSVTIGSPYAFHIPSAVSAYGIRATSSDVNNTGSIEVTSTGGTVEISAINEISSSSLSPRAAAQAAAVARAYGIDAFGGDVDNMGSITVTAVGGTASIQGGTVPDSSAEADAYAYGIYAGGNVYNSGTITVTATGGTAIADDASADAHAYGIYMFGDANLTNTGVIRALGDEAYELHVASGTTTLLDTYNVTLDGDPSQASIYVGDAATLALNDATLAATAIGGETLWDTEYRLFEIGGTGTVDGQFGAVRAVNPNTAVTYYDQGTSDSADDTVALAYAPTASVGSASVAAERQAVSQAVDIVNTHMTTSLLRDLLTPLSSPLLADAGSMVATGLPQSSSGSRDGVFVEPYYSQIDKDADPLGYDATLWGFSGGYERYIENSLVGLHFGYGRSEIDFTGQGQAGNGEDQDVLTGGFSGLTRWNEWSLRYGAAGFYGWHDFAGLTGLALDEREEASYESYGVTANAMVGYPIRRGDHAFLPEVGLSYVWAHRQRYTTDATDPSWNATYSAMNEHDVLAEAAVRWLSSFMHGDVHVTPSVAVGVRHLLTDTESSVWQSVPGAAPVLVSSERDRTALTLAGSVALTKGNHSLSMAYDGEFSSDVRRHNLWLRFGWLF